MPLAAWILTYGLLTLFWYWVFFRGGLEWLEDSWLAALLIHPGAFAWSRDAIELVGWLLWIGSTVWFIIGLFNPRLRFWV